MTLDTTRDELTVHLERALLVSVALPDRPWIGDDPLDELRGLATTAGAVVVGGLLPEAARTSSPAPTSARASSRSCKSRSRPTDADVVIFDNDLSPGQVRNLEKATKRQGARPQRADPRHLRHAGPHRRSPACRSSWPSSNTPCRACGKMWTHLSRYSGGIGTARPRRNAARRRPPARRSAHPRSQAAPRRRAGPQGTRGRAAAARSTPSRWSATPTPARAR